MISVNLCAEENPMGGYSSGRRGGKRITNDMLALDIRKIQRAGRLTPGQSFGWQWTRGGEKIASITMHSAADRVTLTYRNRSYGEDWQDMNYPVRLTWTACHYGGHRAWWLCPAVGCGRRVAVLYGGKVYACRHCHKLAYGTQREQPHDRASSRADKLRNRLGWEAGILNDNGGKPKGMHWCTFKRLEARHDALVNQSLAGMRAKLGRAMERLHSIQLGMADL
jgi:hypothetical protein